jgi:hypothetical protein
MGRRNAYRIMVGKSEGKRQLGGPRRRWVDNNKTDLREIRWGGVDWMDMDHDMDHMEQRRGFVNMLIDLRVQYSVEEFLSSCTACGFS